MAVLTSRRSLLKAVGSAAVAAMLPQAAAAESAKLPAVYHAEAVNARNFIAVFEALRKESGIELGERKIGIKLHGDEVRINRELWLALQAHGICQGTSKKFMRSFSLR